MNMDISYCDGEGCKKKNKCKRYFSIESVFNDCKLAGMLSFIHSDSCIDDDYSLFLNNGKYNNKKATEKLFIHQETK